MFKSLLVILSLFIFTLELSSAALHDHQAHETAKENCFICAVTNQSCDFDITSNIGPILKPASLIAFSENYFSQVDVSRTFKHSPTQARAPPINL